jgi:hypothetical protein
MKIFDIAMNVKKLGRMINLRMVNLKVDKGKVIIEVSHKALNRMERT